MRLQGCERVAAMREAVELTKGEGEKKLGLGFAKSKIGYI